MRSRPTLVIMAKRPAAGRVKTRLARAIGVTDATRFYRATAGAVIGRLAHDPRWRTVIAVDPDIVEAARILVRFEPPGHAVRVNITLPAELLAAVDKYATREGFTRSGLLAQAVRERMRREREAA